MVKSQRKESTDPRLNPDGVPGKGGNLLRNVVNRGRRPAHSLRGKAAQPKDFLGSKVLTLRKSTHTESII